MLLFSIFLLVYMCRRNANLDNIEAKYRQLTKDLDVSKTNVIQQIFDHYRQKDEQLEEACAGIRRRIDNAKEVPYDNSANRGYFIV